MGSVACDICGSGAGSNYTGILPEFNKYITGVRYKYNTVLAHLGTGGNITHLTTKEKYNTAEAWAGWNINQRVRIMASVPYNFNQRAHQGIIQHKNGIGDISLSVLYQLVNKKNKPGDNKLLAQSLWLGGGGKLATGKYNPADKSGNAQNANLFQLGTGSFDFNINAMYDIRLRNAGIYINSSYKINTANKYNYQYGNKLSLNTQAYYKFVVKNGVMIGPNAGIQYENASADRDENTMVFASGGNLLSGTLGIETAFGKFAAGINFQKPISQNLANHIIKAGDRLMLHVALAL